MKLAFHDRGNAGQQNPTRGVVDGCAGNRDGPNLVRVIRNSDMMRPNTGIAVIDTARSQKETKPNSLIGSAVPSVPAAGEIIGLMDRCQQQAEPEGQGNSGGRNGWRRFAVKAQMGEIELQADQKQQKNQTQLPTEAKIQFNTVSNKCGSTPGMVG